MLFRSRKAEEGVCRPCTRKPEIWEAKKEKEKLKQYALYLVGDNRRRKLENQQTTKGE